MNNYITLLFYLVSSIIVTIPPMNPIIHNKIANINSIIFFQYVTGLPLVLTLSKTGIK